MLSDQNRPVIEATLPVVGQHIGEIAQRFYRHMFANHPRTPGRDVQPRAWLPRPASHSIVWSIRSGFSPETRLRRSIIHLTSGSRS